MGDARIVLTTLIDEKLLSPGPKKLYVSYYRKRVYADLLPDGSIRFKDQVYTSPVPCALHMKRTLNPSLKTDAGWSSMYSAASGESLKDIKDRLNIRKRGTNARSAHKEKKAALAPAQAQAPVPAPSPTTKERMAQAAAALAKQEAAPKCAICRKEAAGEVANCSACHSQTHFKCVTPPLQAAPPSPWFCDKCLTGQANRILEFLQQTRRVLVERITEQKKAIQQTEGKPEQTDASAEQEVSTEDKQDEADDAPKAPQEDEEMPAVADEEKDEEADKAAETDSAEKPADAPSTGNEASVDDSKATAEVSTEPKDATSTSTEALEEKEIKQEALDAISTNEESKSSEEIIVVDDDDNTAVEMELVATKPTTSASAEEKFLVLIDSLIADVSSKTERANLIANSTGATLVHLEKTQLVQLVEYGKREILAATRPEAEEEYEDNDQGETEDDDNAVGRSNTSEVDDLIRIFDLRHQILSSQAQFERTTSALAKRTEKHLRNAETELMDLEEARIVEASTIMKVVDLINQYSSDLNKCEQKIHFDETLLESISHRRNFIRSTNIVDRFVPAYRYSSKLMTTSSDQLLLTVLLDKLRDITGSVNEWTKMENHFEKMTSSLKKSLTLIGTKRTRTGVPVKLPPTPALFAKVKIPPSRRLIERQIANYQVNLNAIRQNRARMRKTLSGILKIAREEHLSEEIVNMTDMLYQKCRDLKAEEEEKQLKLKEEEAEAEAKAKKDEDHDESTDGGEVSAEEPEAKKPRLTGADTASGSSSGVVGTTNATPASKAPASHEAKGISQLLGSEDSDAKESSYSSAESKSRADDADDSEGDLEQASRAIADITSSVLPDISAGSDPLLNSPPMTAKPAAEASQELAPQGQFSIRGGKGADKREAAPKETEQQKGQASKGADQSEQSFLDQALEVLNKQQQQQQRLEQQRLEQQRQLEQQQKQLEEQQQQLEKQRRLEQQRQLEQQRLEQQRQERERHERERQDRERRERERLEKQQRLERQRIEKQRQEQERREQQRREQQRLEQERREQQRIEQQRIEQQRLEEQRRMEEQRRIEEEQRRLEQQRLEQQRLEQQRLEQQQKQRLEQQRLEQQRLEKQRQEQQRLEQQRLEQQRLEQQRQEQQRLEQQRQEQQRLEQQRLEKQRQEQQRQEQQRRQQEQQRLELQRRQQEQQRQEQQRQFQRNKVPNLPQVPGSSHLQMLNQQQQQLQQQQAALQQQQHSRQMQHPLYGDIPKGMLMSSGMGSSQQDIYAQQAAQMGMDMHDVVRHQDSGHFVGNASGGLRGAPYEVSRSEPAPTAPRTSFYGDDGSQDVFGSQGLPGQQRQLPDHHMFNDLQQQQQQQQPGQPQSRGMVSQDFLLGRGSYRHPGMDQPDDSDVNMGDWGQ